MSFFEIVMDLLDSENLSQLYKGIEKYEKRGYSSRKIYSSFLTYSSSENELVKELISDIFENGDEEKKIIVLNSLDDFTSIEELLGDEKIKNCIINDLEFTLKFIDGNNQRALIDELWKTDEGKELLYTKIEKGKLLESIRSSTTFDILFRFTKDGEKGLELVSNNLTKFFQENFSFKALDRLMHEGISEDTIMRKQGLFITLF